LPDPIAPVNLWQFASLFPDSLTVELDGTPLGVKSLFEIKDGRRRAKLVCNFQARDHPTTRPIVYSKGLAFMAWNVCQAALRGKNKTAYTGYSS